MENLPVEVFDRILDYVNVKSIPTVVDAYNITYVERDQRSLFALVLTSRTLYYRTVPRLYETISFIVICQNISTIRQSKTRCIRLLDSLLLPERSTKWQVWTRKVEIGCMLSPDPMDEHRALKLLRVLSSIPAGRLQSFVCFGQYSIPHDIYSQVFDQHQLQSLGAEDVGKFWQRATRERFQNLRELIIGETHEVEEDKGRALQYACQLESLRACNLDVPNISNLTKLSCLDLRYCGFDSPDCLGALANLRELHLDECDIWHSVDGYVTFPPILAQLEKFSLKVCNAWPNGHLEFPLVSQLLSRCLRLKYLTLNLDLKGRPGVRFDYNDEESVAEFRKTLVQCSENLEVLILRIHHRLPDMVFRIPTESAGFHVLRELTISSNYTLYKTSTTEDNLQYILHILPPTVVCLTIYLIVTSRFSSHNTAMNVNPELLKGMIAVLAMNVNPELLEAVVAGLWEEAPSNLRIVKYKYHQGGHVFNRYNYGEGTLRMTL